MGIRFIKNLENIVADTVHDPDIANHLEDPTRLKTVYSYILNRVVTQMYAARDSILFPDQIPPSTVTLEPCYAAAAADGDYSAGWSRLASDAGNVARHLVQDFREASKGRAAKDKAMRRERASQTVLALRLMLLARFYELRATINQNVAEREVLEDPFQRQREVIKEMKQALDDYDEQVRAWELDREVAPGWKASTDASSLNVWSRDFGRAHEAELGWSPFARTIGTELRFQRHRVELRERWGEVLHVSWRRTRVQSRLQAALWRFFHFIGYVLFMPLRLITAGAFWIFGLTTGFGLKPTRFAATTMIVIGLFSSLYFADSVLSACDGATWAVESYLPNLFYAVSSLTGLGAAIPKPCSTYTGALVSLESLIGYFLLAVLAAMLFSWLTER